MALPRRLLGGGGRGRRGGGRGPGSRGALRRHCKTVVFVCRRFPGFKDDIWLIIWLIIAFCI